MTSPISEWQKFELEVRDGTTSKKDALERFPSIVRNLRELCADRVVNRKEEKWVFPLSGYDRNSVGQGGFKPDIRYGSSPIKGYDFFDGNRHGGHPAYDIFIVDKDQDSRDDRTKNAVEVLAPVDLLILSFHSAWSSDSPIRGGNYLWAYDPSSDRLFYFAHMDQMIAKPGNFVSAGDVLGTLGRTGKAAAEKRSPTHLHFMVLQIENSRLTPVDTWPMLKKAQALGATRAAKP